ncbi:MAG: Arginase, partial [uncultured Rubrobacteraceae bacterium]
EKHGRASGRAHRLRALRLRAARRAHGCRPRPSLGQRAPGATPLRVPAIADLRRLGPRDRPAGRGGDRVRVGPPGLRAGAGGRGRGRVPARALRELQHVRRDDRRGRSGGPRRGVVRRPRGLQHAGDDDHGFHGRDGPRHRRGPLLEGDDRGRAGLLPGCRGERGARRREGDRALGGDSARGLGRRRRRRGSHRVGGAGRPRGGARRVEGQGGQGLRPPRPRRPRPGEGWQGQRVRPQRRSRRRGPARRARHGKGALLRRRGWDRLLRSCLRRGWRRPRRGARVRGAARRPHGARRL